MRLRHETKESGFVSGAQFNAQNSLFANSFPEASRACHDEPKYEHFVSFLVPGSNRLVVARRD